MSDTGIKIGKYMTAHRVPMDPHDVYTIQDRSGSIIGTVDYYKAWKQYCFSPESGSIFSDGCLGSMSDFLEGLNQVMERKRTRGMRYPLSVDEFHELFDLEHKGIEPRMTYGLQVPTEYVEGEWCWPAADGQEPWAVITFASEPSPETGHVGWCWWALGDMGDATTYDEARQKAEASLQRRVGLT